jgi:hypothetical protein
VSAARAGLAGARIRVRAGLALLVAGALAASCAPTVPRGAPPDVSTIATRYERQRGSREGRLAAARLESTVWVQGRRLGHWPALQVDLALVGPDAVRARVASLVGTALDLTVRGDSLRAYFPPRRIVLETSALEESLGIRAPAAWTCRALAASWNAQGARWVMPPGDSLWHAAWTEAGDSLALTVAADGLPLAIEMHDAAGRTHRLRYVSWQSIDRVLWPERLSLDEDEGLVRIAMRVDHARFPSRPDPRWLSLHPPASAERVDWGRLRSALTRLGEVE